MPASPAPGSRGLRSTLVLLGLLAGLLAPAGRPLAGERWRGPVAVLGLIGSEPGDTATMAAAVQAALSSLGGPAALPADEIARRLGRGAPPGAAADDLARLRGLFQQGYLQSYSFEYAAAVASLQAVLRGLDDLAEGEERWDLFVRAHVFLGIACAGLQDEPGALQAFAAVLRTRPEMQLPRAEYAPRSIALWESARRALPGLPRGRLAVDSEPSGAEVRLDGVRVGATPYIGEWPQGSYLVEVRSQEAGTFSRRVQLEAESVQLRVQLAFEAALDLRREHPCLHLPAGAEAPPDLWWPWLGARLGIRHAVLVRHRLVEGRPRWVASLLDLTRGRILREGWLEPQDPAADARALAEFAATGRRAEGLVLAPAPAPLPGSPPGEVVPPLPGERGRPWYRAWWPYALAGLVLAGGGAGAHLASDHYDQLTAEADTQGELSERERLAEGWLGAAVAGYCLGGVALVVGLVLHFTWVPQVPSSIEAGGGGAQVLPYATGDSLGLGVVGRF